jgi:hypothetical protein
MSATAGPAEAGKFELKTSEQIAKEAQEIRTRWDNESISPAPSLVFGIIITILISIPVWGLIVALILLLFRYLFEMSVSLAVVGSGSTVITLLLMTRFFFFPRIIKIKTGWKGIIKFLGKRHRRKVLDEGYAWVPPLVEVEMESLKEQNEDINEKEFLVAGETLPGGEIGKEKGRMIVDSSVQWMIEDLFIFLDVGPEEVIGGLHDTVVAAIREVTGSASPLTLPRMGRQLGETIDHYATAQAKRWGIRILNVNVTWIKFADKATSDAFEKSLRESLEKSAELTETDTLMLSAEKIIKGFKEIDSQATVSPETAIWASQRERNKATGNEFHLTGELSDVLKALVGILGKRNGEEGTRP